MLPVTVAVSTPTVFEHTVGELTVTTGFGFTLTTTEQIFVHPFVATTVVTVNEPAPPAFTKTERPLVGPMIVPLPASDQSTDDPGMLNNTE